MFFKNERRTLQLPLNPLLNDDMQNAHECEMRSIRAWYIRQHNLPIRNQAGGDRELLDKSVDYVFPRECYLAIIPH